MKPVSNVRPFTIGAGNWPLILKLRHNIWIWSGQIFDILPSFCVMWYWSWHKRLLRRVDLNSINQRHWAPVAPTAQSSVLKHNLWSLYKKIEVLVRNLRNSIIIFCDAYMLSNYWSVSKQPRMILQDQDHNYKTKTAKFRSWDQDWGLEDCTFFWLRLSRYFWATMYSKYANMWCTVTLSNLYAHRVLEEKNIHSCYWL